jgi:hypothetical protein
MLETMTVSLNIPMAITTGTVHSQGKISETYLDGTDIKGASLGPRC